MQSVLASTLLRVIMVKVGLFRAMPRYSSIADSDIMDLVAHLRSLDPVENEVPHTELNEEVEASRPEEASPAVAPTDPIERGLYLAQITNCGSLSYTTKMKMAA